MRQPPLHNAVSVRFPVRVPAAAVTVDARGAARCSDYCFVYVWYCPAMKSISPLADAVNRGGVIGVIAADGQVPVNTQFVPRISVV